MSKISNKNTLSDYVDVYLANKNNKDELEVRFATKQYNPLTKIKFDKTIEKLRNSGFEIVSSNEYHLNIQTEFFDVPSGRKKISNIRTTIRGLFNIQKYCKTNTFNMDVVPEYISFMQKFYKSKYLKGVEKYYPIALGCTRLRNSCRFRLRFAGTGVSRGVWVERGTEGGPGVLRVSGGSLPSSSP